MKSVQFTSSDDRLSGGKLVRPLRTVGAYTNALITPRRSKKVMMDDASWSTLSFWMGFGWLINVVTFIVIEPFTQFPTEAVRSTLKVHVSCYSIYPGVSISNNFNQSDQTHRITPNLLHPVTRFLIQPVASFLFPTPRESDQQHFIA